MFPCRLLQYTRRPAPVLLPLILAFTLLWLLNSALTTSNAVQAQALDSFRPLEPSVTDPTVVATVTVGSHPIGVGVNLTTNRIYVANVASSTVSVIDGAHNTIITTVIVGSSPRGVGVNPTTNRIYVGNCGSNSVSVLDGTNNTIIATVTVGSCSSEVGVNPTTNHIYVPNQVSNTVSVIDGTNNTVVATVPVGLQPYGVGVNPSTNRIYVSNQGSNTISVINGENNTVVATVTVGANPIGVGGVNQKANRIYVANQGNANVSVIDGTDNTAVATVAVGKWPWGVGVNPTTNRIYVTNQGSSTISVIDGANSTFAATVSVGVDPTGIGVNTTTGHIYITNYSSDNVSVIQHVPCENAITVHNAADAGPGSLRQAIADACPGGTITFNGDQSIYLNNTLFLTKELTIDGGNYAITVSGDSLNDGSRNVRVFYISSTGVVTLRNLSIVSGTADYGGGIYNDGTLSMLDCVLSGNLVTDSGGGLYNIYGMVTISNTDFSGNSADYFGGGIAGWDYSKVTVMSSTFSSNSAGFGGGAICLYHGTITMENSNLSRNSAPSGGGIESSAGVLTVTNSILSNNSADYGGGIRNGDGPLTLQHSTVSGNTAIGEGGGILNLGMLTMTDSTLFGNSVSGGPMLPGFGGGIYSEGVLTIQNSIVSANLATSGGGIEASGTTVVQNSTIYSNSVSTYGGGGIRNGGTLTLTSSTVSGNSAPDSGGGIYNTYGGILNLYDSIVANNAGGDCININTVIAQDHNLIGDAIYACGLINGVDGNVTGQDPLLEPLADNGGSTWTMALLPGSPAIDAGNDATCLSTDQRGTIRPQGVHCDIGAYEYQFTQSTYTLTVTTAGTGSGVVSPTVGSYQYLYGDVVTLTATPLVNSIFTGWSGDVSGASNPITVKMVTNKSVTATFSSCGNDITVSNAADDGPGSLRQAIADACPGGVITFNGDQSIYLSSTLVLTKELIIDGGDNAIIVSGDSLNDGSRDVRVFDIATAGVVTLNHLSIVSGRPFDGGMVLDGGGISNYYGTLTIQNSLIAGNSGSVGSGISNGGSLTLKNSTLAGNFASMDGGAIYNWGILTMTSSTVSGNSAGAGGGIYNQGDATLQNSTLSNNTALLMYEPPVGGGGGIVNNGRLTLTNSTLYGNSSTYAGGGIYNNTNGKLYIYDTLIANSSSGDCANFGTVVTQDHNLIRDTSNACEIINGVNGSIVGQDPLIGSLDDYGGDTATYALALGSPAMDAGNDATCLDVDQRGMSRPQGSHCDIGAYEAALIMSKNVVPAVVFPYPTIVTYTAVLFNASSVVETNLLFTDTLPGGVVFGQWIESPTGGLLTQYGNAITWTGVLTNNTALTFTFTATNSQSLGGVIINTAWLSGTNQVGRAMAGFKICAPITVITSNDSGPGSLRQAIVDACPGDEITFDDNYAIYLNSTLNITKPLTIDGGNYTITVSGDSLNDGTRDVQVFNIRSEDPVTLSHLNIVSGTANGGGGGIANSGALRVQASTISGNFAYYNSGGGILNEGTLTVTNSTISGNSVGRGVGGGLWNAGMLTVQDSIISGNSASSGGGIRQEFNQPLTLQNVIIAGNSADENGGGIDIVAGTITITNSTLAENSAYYGGGINNWWATLMVNNSTFNSNSATGLGGGLYSSSGTIVIDNSTFTANSAIGLGGGLHNGPGHLSLRNSTLFGNSAGLGGGLDNLGGTIALTNTLIANSTSGGDCVNSGTLTTDHNLIEDTAYACGLSNGANGNIIGQNPRLGPLADNGGSTWTHALLLGSSAIDAGNDTACLSIDQRGVLRPQGEHCDIGAYEATFTTYGAFLPLIRR